MYETFFPERLAQLRNLKNISAREMSLAIGQNRNYINQIENRKMFPTMQTFFYICDYLGITPKEFFDHQIQHPQQLSQLVEGLQKLSADDLALITQLVARLGEKA